MGGDVSEGEGGKVGRAVDAGRGTGMEPIAAQQANHFVCGAQSSAPLQLGRSFGRSSARAHLGHSRSHLRNRLGYEIAMFEALRGRDAAA
ncbi:hypothetical protein [Brevundimonas sp.]|jgi:hypothetical protein|uniref:hypothetical protein n=1 Tax=Brevundimonas sp. TaxID=1871086 RepID=UPI002E102679|nr:hypothetical protein [Brevundimonas sp.]